MALWLILEPLLVILLAVLLFSQVVLPPLIGKPFFWLFRKPARMLRKEEAKIEDEKILKEVKEREKELERIKKAKKPIKEEKNENE